MSIQYRKQKDGSWAVFGPASEVKVGRVTVTRKDGQAKDETVVRTSKPFDVDGVPHCYGYLGEREAPARRQERGSGRPAGGVSKGRPVCAECGRPGALVSDLEDGLYKHYGCCDIPP